MRAWVLGAGRSGAAAAELLRHEGVAVEVLDGDVPFPASAARDDLVVVSPGIALNHPWQQAARQCGLRVLSELQLGAERYRMRGGRMLAVTGSKGKSSVVKLVADTLARAGQSAVPCGNYGTPLCAVYNTVASVALPWAVVEVSSFQLETTVLAADTFVAAALLNLQDDHLDRHGSREAYHALKRGLLAMTPEPVDATRMPVPGADGGDVLLAGSYFDNAVLRPNGLAAVALLRAAGLDDAAIAAGFAGFVPLPHRCQLVCERGGVKYVDDSKATSLAALAAGVAMMGAPVRLVAGGLGKGDDPLSVIIPLQSGAKKVYLIGRCADQLYAAWHSAVPCERCGTLEVAVAAASRDACPGEVVLLSPGAASFDQFTSYGARGDRFAALVKEG